MLRRHLGIIMKFMTKEKGYATLKLLAVTLCMTLASSAAEEKIVKPTDLPATVIAHLPLPQASGSQMLLQRENAKLYLYVQQAAKQGFMVVMSLSPKSQAC